MIFVRKFCNPFWRFGKIKSQGSEFRSSSSSAARVAGINESQLIDHIVNLVIDHPFPSQALQRLWIDFPDPLLLSPWLLNSVLGRLFSGHANALKAYDFFRFCLRFLKLNPSPEAFEKVLLILSRAREFEKIWCLMQEIQQKYPLLITSKSLSIVLSKYAKFRSFEDTLRLFEGMEKLLGKDSFGADEYNVLLHAFCTQRQMKEARAVFSRYCSRFQPDAKTFNILLMGFKTSRNIAAMEVFYHDMVRRGFKPNYATYNIRIDAYCKKGCFLDALRIFEEMENQKIEVTLETMTTLIYGAGIVRNPVHARQLFDEIPKRKLKADIGSHNALLGAYFRAGDIRNGIQLMEEIEEQGIGCDAATYHTVFWGLRKFREVDAVSHIYKRMVENNLVPKMRTVVMLMKFFCDNGRCDLGLDLWEYLLRKGCCPHGHALDLLVTGLCCRGRLEVAFRCTKQVVKRGKHPGNQCLRVLVGFLEEAGQIGWLHELKHLMNRLQTFLPPSRQPVLDATG